MCVNVNASLLLIHIEVCLVVHRFVWSTPSRFALLTDLEHTLHFCPHHWSLVATMRLLFCDRRGIQAGGSRQDDRSSHRCTPEPPSHPEPRCYSWKEEEISLRR